MSYKINFQTVQFAFSCGFTEQLPESDCPEIVFSGRSNVGKSSLINKLCVRKNLARISSMPGKTATINYYDANGLYFVDLPGYGYAKASGSKREQWNELIDGYLNSGRNIALVLQLLDARHEPSIDDLTMLEYLNHNNIFYYVVLTKMDKLKKSQIQQTEEYFNNYCSQYNAAKVILTSADNNYGIEGLQNSLNDILQEEE